MAAYDWPGGDRTSVIFGERCYVLRRGDEMLVGSTMESVGFDVRVTPDGLAEVRRKVSAIYPPVADLVPKRTWAGLRPGTPDGRPIIGSEPHLPGLWYATGHGRNGILLAGVTAELVARGIGGEPLGDDLAAVRPTRFWGW
jgi:glycine oxidase